MPSPDSKPGWPRWLRFRMSGRTILLVPMLVAAFFAGWAANRQHQHQTYLEDVTASRDVMEQYQREMRAQRPKRLSRDETMILIDGAEHRQRMKSLQNGWPKP